MLPVIWVTALTRLGTRDLGQGQGRVCRGQGRCKERSGGCQGQDEVINPMRGYCITEGFEAVRRAGRAGAVACLVSSTCMYMSGHRLLMIVSW